MGCPSCLLANSESNIESMVNLGNTKERDGQMKNRFLRIAIKMARQQLSRKGFKGEALRLAMIQESYMRSEIDIIEGVWEKILEIGFLSAARQTADRIQLIHLSAEWGARK
jgi:hypothetical protein